MGDRSRRWRCRKWMWREVMTEQKPCNPPQHRSKKSVKQQQKQRKKDQIFFFQMGLVFGKSAHTTCFQRMGSVVCRPFWIRCYNSGQASGFVEPKWRWIFPASQVNALAVECWCVGRLLMGRWGVRVCNVGWWKEGRGGRGGPHYNIWRHAR